MAVSCDTQGVYVWDVSVEEPQVFIPAGSAATAFSPDGQWLASASSWGAIKIWDATTGHLHVNLPVVCGSEPQAAFSRDGTVLASADSAGKIHLWNPETGQHVLEFSGNIRADTRLAFAPDGNTLASSNDEGSVTLWDVETGQERSTLNKRGDWVYCLAFSPDGAILVTGGDAGSVEFWRATTKTDEALSASLPESRDELARRARARAALLERYGRWAEAQQSYSEAIGILEPLVVRFPDSDQYRRDLAECCLRLARLLIGPSDTQPIHIEKAVTLAKKAVDLAPNQPDGWLTLGVALRKRGDFAQALPALQNAIAVRRNVWGTDWFQLAMVHEQLGEHEKGEAAYRRALAWYLLHAPNNEDVTQIARQTAELLDVAPHLRVPASPHERCKGLPSDLALFLDFAPDTVLQGFCATLVCDLSGSQNFGKMEEAEVVGLGGGQFGLVCDGGQLRLREPLLNGLKQYTVVGWLRKPPTVDKLLLLSEYNAGGIVSEIAVVGTHGILVAAWNRNTPGNWSHARVQPPFCLNGQPIFLAVRFRESQDGSSAAIVTINDQTFHVSSQAVAYNGNGHAEIGGDVGILQRVAVFRRSLSDDELNRIREMGRPTEETPAVINWGELLKSHPNN